MPNLLIVTDAKFSGEEFASIAEGYGFTSMSTNSIKEALAWLDEQDIHALLAPISLDSISQQGFSNALWSKSPNAPFMLYAPNETNLDLISTAKIYGAEILFGGLSTAKFKTLIEAAAEDETLSPMSVMIVEDLDTTRNIISMYVEGLGNYSVDSHSSAKEAMAQLAANPEKFSCIMTDIHMPEIDGKAFISYVRNEPLLENLPVIVLTAYGTMDTLIECLKLGATGFLAKPPKKSDMLRELARAKRVNRGLASPRLATEEEAESLRRVLIDGWTYEDKE